MKEILAGILAAAIFQVVLYSLWQPSEIRAEDAPRQITLEQYLERVREHHPALARERAELDVVRADLIEAEVLPNPSLEFQTVQRAHGANTIDGAEYEVVLEQPLLLFGQRSARRKMAELTVEAAELAFEAAFFEIATDARLAFIDLLVAQEKAKLFEQSLAHFDKARRVVKTRVEEGAQSQYDLLRLELEIAEVLAEQQAVLAEVRDARFEAAKFIGRADASVEPVDWVAKGSLEDASLGQSRANEPEALPQGELSQEFSDWTEVRGEHPIIRAAIRAQESAVQAIELARAERWPEVGLAVGGLFTTDESSFNIIAGLQFELPIFERGQAEIARAEASAIAARRTLELHETHARAYFEQATERLHAHRAALESFQKHTRNGARRLRAMAEESYAGGHSGILELLDALQTISALEQTELELAADIYKARVEWAAAAGKF